MVKKEVLHQNVSMNFRKKTFYDILIFMHFVSFSANSLFYPCIMTLSSAVCPMIDSLSCRWPQMELGQWKWPSSICLSVRLSVRVDDVDDVCMVSIVMMLCLSVYLSVSLSVSLSICLFVCLSVCQRWWRVHGVSQSWWCCFVNDIHSTRNRPPGNCGTWDNTASNNELSTSVSTEPWYNSIVTQFHLSVCLSVRLSFCLGTVAHEAA